MDVSLSCKVSWRENLILNGSFESWNESGVIPNYWEAVNADSGEIDSVQSPGGFGVKIETEEADMALRTGIEQVFNFSAQGTHKVSFSYKGYVSVIIWKKNGSEWLSTPYDRNSEVWTNDYIEFDTSSYDTSQPLKITLKPQSDKTAYFDNVVVSTSNYNYGILNTDSIFQIDNVVREIEDNIFAYRSANLDFSLLDVEQGSEYFDIDTFFSVNTSIFRFDFEMEYLSSNLTRNVTVFAANHDMKRVTDFNSDIPTRIDIRAYEILSFLKEKDMYLGSLTQDVDDDNDPEGDPYYLYSSSEHNPNSIYESPDIAVYFLRNEFLQIINRKQIPITEQEVIFNNNIDLSDVDDISFSFDDVIGDGDNEYYVKDAYYNENTERTYLLLIDADNLDRDAETYLYEIKNGSELINLGHSIAWGQDGCFIHTYNSNTYSYNDDGFPSQDATIECVVCRFYRDVGGTGVYYAEARYYCFGNDEYFSDAESTEHNFREFSYIYDSEAGAYGTTQVFLNQQYCSYVNAGGDVAPRGYSVDYNNFAYLTNNPQIENQYGVYQFGNIYPYDWDYFLGTWYQVYGKMTATISRFPTAFYYNTKNITLGTMLKEISMLYDAYFYLDYTNATFGQRITVNIYSRSGDADGSEITLENEVYSDLSFSRLDFSGLTLKTYESDTRRLRIYIAYYDMKYGRGSKKYTKELFGIKNINLGDFATINSIQYLVTYLEYKPDEHKTEIVLQEIK